jgi:GNAT superfamily N-acetyltransferase
VTSFSGEYEISNDSQRIDFDRVEALLRTSYWASEWPRDLMEQATANSLPFGVYRRSDRVQVAFCRVVTDFASFGWVTDVIVDADCRGAGIGKALMQAVVNHPRLSKIRLALATRDAHGLYEQSGFALLPRPERWMMRPGELDKPN